jgi:NAD(P)-dependent dehydrogenase (short-subunit alcohol dehydrogenase family)
MDDDGAAPHGIRAIVTGGNSGIGEAIAVVFAERGMDIGFTWHEDEAGAKEVAAKIEALGRRVAVTELDLTEPENGPLAIERLIDELGGLDVFVNNAGTGHSTPFVELELDTWRRVLDVDLTGAFMCLRTAARHMVRLGHGGRIVNMAPGEIATKMTGNEDVDPRTVVRETIPAGRPCHAREVAEAVAFLVSRGGADTTGASIVVDGGLMLMGAVANQDSS